MQCIPKTGPRTIFGPHKSLNWSVGIFFDPKHAKIWFKVSFYWSNIVQSGPQNDFVVNGKRLWLLWSATWKSLGNTALRFYVYQHASILIVTSRILWHFILPQYYIQITEELDTTDLSSFDMSGDSEEDNVKKRQKSKKSSSSKKTHSSKKSSGVVVLPGETNPNYIRKR